MKNILLFLSSMIILSACQPERKFDSTIQSRDQSKKLSVFVTEDGKIGYTLTHDNVFVVDTSYLGLDFQSMDLIEDFELVDAQGSSYDGTWEQPWGEDRIVKNQYNELFLAFEQGPEQRNLNLRFRLFDDGVGFRYEVPRQLGLDSVVIMDEFTQFNLTGDHKTWWIPGDWDIYEHLYNTTFFSEIHAISKRDHPNLAQSTIPENAVNTPVTMKTSEGIHIAIHEADLTNYSGMTLKADADNLRFESELVGSRDDSKVKTKAPFNTPWRVILATERAGDLIESKTVLNLNEPNKLGDVSWFTPMKYIGIWWEMHLDKSTWDLASGKHGATTENTKRYIDFAAENGFGGVLVEGWNTGWEEWLNPTDREGIFDFVTPYEDYDLAGVVEYGKQKGVEIIMHHETSGAPRTYDQQLDTAYALMESLGIHSVKTGYVGKIIPEGEYHHGQWMVNHYHKVLLKGAEHKVAINAHEPIKGTGKRRTYPNAIAREGLRGQEFNAWADDGGNPPEHLTIVPFTRMLAGPIDFTPGIFNIKLAPYKEENQVNTTLAHQLGLYVVLYSPIQMAADLPEHYEGQPAFQFIRDVAVDWEKSKVIDGEVGDFVVIARQERGSDKWFVGGVADENGKNLNLSIDFLPEGKRYKAVVYADGENAHWDDNPTDIKIYETDVDNNSEINVEMAPGGGLAISLFPF